MRQKHANKLKMQRYKVVIFFFLFFILPILGTLFKFSTFTYIILKALYLLHILFCSLRDVTFARFYAFYSILRTMSLIFILLSKHSLCYVFFSSAFYEQYWINLLYVYFLWVCFVTIVSFMMLKDLVVWGRQYVLEQVT